MHRWTGVPGKGGRWHSEHLLHPCLAAQPSSNLTSARPRESCSVPAPVHRAIFTLGDCAQARKHGCMHTSRRQCSRSQQKAYQRDAAHRRHRDCTPMAGIRGLVNATGTNPTPHLNHMVASLHCERVLIMAAAARHMWHFHSSCHARTAQPIRCLQKRAPCSCRSTPASQQLQHTTAPTPLLDALISRGDQTQELPFHVPGHKVRLKESTSSRLAVVHDVSA